MLNIDFYADWEVDRILSKILDTIKKDKQTFYEFIEYMKNEMTENEYSTLSEISDKIAYGYPFFALSCKAFVISKI